MSKISHFFKIHLSGSSSISVGSSSKIKLKVWDADAGKMYGPTTLQRLLRREHDDGNAVGAVGVEQYEVDTEEEHYGHLTFLFLAGVDKNGKEVYVGDIIHWNYLVLLSMKHGEIREDIYAVVVPLKVGFGFTIQRVGANKLRTLDIGTAEVFSNIYENPALVGVK